MSRRARSRAAAVAAKHVALVPIGDDDTDTEGPAGTYGCACVADSARLCTLLRYGRDMDAREQHDDDCECLCHTWSDDE